MQFQSKAAAYQVLVRPEVKRYSADGMVVIDTIKPLTAEFGKWGAEYKFQNPMTGSMDTTADIRGHFFDSVIAQEENDWTDEEREIVEKCLLRECNRFPEYIWVYSEPEVPAPWPTYDDTHHKQIPTLAETLGLVEQSLNYERKHKNRPEVVKLLEEALLKDTVEEELTAA